MYWMLNRGAGKLVSGTVSNVLEALSVPPLLLHSGLSTARAHVARSGVSCNGSSRFLQHAAAAPQPVRPESDTGYAADPLASSAATQARQQYAVDYTVNVKSFLLGSQLDLARLKPKFRRELRCVQIITATCHKPHTPQHQHLQGPA